MSVRPDCRCGHLAVLHEHMHGRTYCATCPCPWYSRPRWWKIGPRAW